MSDRGTRTATHRGSDIRRAGLLARLRDNADVPLVVVHAGAGFGKSTLARQWAEEDPRQHVVVQLTAHDDVPALLALRLLDALTSVGAGGEVHEAVTGTEPVFSAIVLPALSRAARSRPSPYVLVVEDIHVLTQPDCHEVLRAVAEGVTPGSQLVLLTRFAPADWLSHARACGRLLEVDAADLAFDRDEALSLVTSLGVQPGDQQAILRRAEGWPVGLYLMAAALNSPGAGGLPDPGLSASRSDRYVADYLRTEVLSGLSPRLREFLRRTSILEELTPAACDAVLDVDGSAAVLRDLSRCLQLVVPLGPDRHRYHQLLADVVRADLGDHEPWLVPTLHGRASAWFESQGEQDAAVRHAKAAGDLERLGSLVWAGTPDCIASGRPDRLSLWLDDLGEGRVRADRWLSLSAAWLGLQTGRPEVMTRWLLAAEEHAGPDWPAHACHDTYAASVASIHATVGDGGLEATLVLCRDAQQGLPRDSPFRAAAVLTEGAVLTLLRQMPEGRDRLGVAEQLARALRVPVVEANALAWQGLLWLVVDDWRRGALLITSAHDLVREHGLDRLTTAAFTVSVVALVQAARGGAEDARRTLGTARRLTAEASRIAPWFSVMGPLVQARAAMLLDDGPQARTLYDEARAHMRTDLTDTLLSDLLADAGRQLRTLRVDGVSAGALTAAELRVLQFLPSRLTFRQIGEHLFISGHTVKSHAMAIYHKLGVSSRDEAIGRARSLGLVESSRGE
jgi:LuxR family maltose regulon positive regulatory protein